MRPSLILLPLALAALPADATAPKKPATAKASSAKASSAKAVTPGKSAAAAKPASAAPHVTVDPDISGAIADPGRSETDRARDRYRHPAQTLSFFGLKRGMTVIEIMPGGGWYSAILAPYLAEQGQYVAAVPPGKTLDGFNALVAGDTARYAKTKVVAYAVGQPTELVPSGSADMVLTFRNIHNLLGSPDQPGDGNAPQAFSDWFAALKPGGTLGIVEHRLPEQMDIAREKTTGYVKRSTVIRLAMAAGFQLVAASDVNANPKDDHDHPKGVWTLPPSYELGDVDKAKYAAIGESDRMTLRFVKPGGPASGAAATSDAASAPASDRAAPADPARPDPR